MSSRKILIFGIPAQLSVCGWRCRRVALCHRCSRRRRGRVTFGRRCSRRRRGRVTFGRRCSRRRRGRVTFGRRCSRRRRRRVTFCHGRGCFWCGRGALGNWRSRFRCSWRLLCCFAPGQEPTLIRDPAAGQHDDQQCAPDALLQEWQPDAEPAGDEQPTDQTRQHDHRPIFEAPDQDQADDAACHSEQPHERAGRDLKDPRTPSRSPRRPAHR